VSGQAFQVDFTGSRFLETSTVKAQANRLNWRCELLLARHPEAIRGRRILDLASHDGRFSYACLKLGAAHVTGIEGREHFVRHAEETLGALGVGDRARFLQGDIFDVLPTLEPGPFDTVLCFGFLYHTIRQVELFQQVRRLGVRHLIIDTQIREPPYERIRTLLDRFGLGRLTPTHMRETAFLEFRHEDHRRESNTITETGIVAVPTEALVGLLYQYFGFEWRRIEWSADVIADWSFLGDYQRRRRASYIGVARQPASSAAGGAVASA
jgi:protein-L-isoaspartate O-methyltransferase